MQTIEELLDTNNRYRLLQPLSSKVYQAVDLYRGEVVAVKLLHCHPQDNPDFTYAMALYHAISNEYIAVIKDYGTTKTGRYFYTMEYVEGQTLARTAESITPDRALNLVKQICKGLLPAHQGVNLPYWNLQQGALSHQKLHPDHIMVTPADRVKILNFGFVSEEPPLGELTESQTMVTASGGEFHYVAPEQLDKQEPTPRSDVYVLGLILYELLAGTNPYNLEVQEGLPWVMAHTTTQPVPLRRQAGCHYFPVELEQALVRCLAKSPQERYSDAGELLIDLQEIANLSRSWNNQPTQPHIITSPGEFPSPPTSQEDQSTVFSPRADKLTSCFDAWDAPTVVESSCPPTGRGLGKSFTIGDQYTNYSTFLENPTKQNNFRLILISITVGTVVGLSIFAGIILWQRHNQPTPPPPNVEPIDRSI